MFNNFNGGLFGSPSTKGNFNLQVDNSGTTQSDGIFVQVPYKDFALLIQNQGKGNGNSTPSESTPKKEEPFFHHKR